MISDIFEDLISGLITKSAPQTRDQSVAVIDNADSVVIQLGKFADQLNTDKAGTRESYKLGHRYNVPATSTVFVYADRPDIIVDVEVLSSEFMNTKAFDDRYYIDGLVEVLAGTNCIGVNINAFQNCKTLKKVELPNVTGILHRAFEGCTGLEEVIIPLCTELSDAVFDGCSSLKSVSCPSLSVRIGTAFSQCENLEVVDFSALESVPSKVGVLIGSSTYFSNADVIVKDSLLDTWKASFTEDVARIFSKTQYSIVHNKDLDAYQLKSDMSAYVKAADLAAYAKASEYTKTTVLESTYAKKTDLDNYDKKTDALDGSRIEIGTRTYSFTDNNDNASNLSQITFTPEALGMGDGDKLTSFTIRTRSNNFHTSTVCLKFVDGDLQIGVTDLVEMTEANHDYKFTLVNPITLRAGKTYIIQFHDSADYGSSALPLGLRLYNGGSGTVYDIYVNNLKHIKPCVSAEFIATATIPSLSKLIKSIIDTRSSESIAKLEPLRNVTTIGSSDYSYDDVKDRVDTILTVLKSFM